MTTKDFLKYRNVWMGIAMVWIAWYHSIFQPALHVLDLVKEIGYGGVDICLFASGLGCYFSLSRNSDLGSFMKRRFSRVYPTYVCFIWIWILCQIVIKETPMPLQAVLGNILGIQYLTSVGFHFNWYISAIFLFYLFAPCFQRLADGIKGKWNQVIVVLFFVLLSVPFWNDKKFIIIMTRIPIFYMGMLTGKKCAESSWISGREMLMQILAAMVGAGLLLINYKYFRERLWNYGLHWYPFILITPGMCVAVSFLANMLDKHKFGQGVVRVIDMIGRYSLEVYLVHVLVFNMTKYMIKSVKILPNTGIVWLCAVVCVITGCVALRYMTQCVHKWIASMKK